MQYSAALSSQPQIRAAVADRFLHDFFLQRLRRKMFKIFSGAFGVKCAKVFPAPSAPNVQIFLWRLRHNKFKIFSGAFGANLSKMFPAPSAQNVQNFLRRLWPKMFKDFLQGLRHKIFKLFPPLCTNYKYFFPIQSL